MPLWWTNGLGWKEISLSRMRSLLRNLLRWWSLPLRDEKFFSASRAEPHRGSQRKKFWAGLCKNAQIVLWSQVMSAEPRSDHRENDQSEELKKGNTHKTSRTMAAKVVAWHQASRGLIAADRRSPHFSLSSLLPVPGLAGARASTVSVALTRVRRRRISGRPGESD